MKDCKIAILGFGTVGSGVYRIVTENHDDILRNEELDIHVNRILVRDFEHEPNLHMAPREVFTTNFADIAADPEVTVVVECMGGVEPARTFILKSLQAGKSVVTSNKEVVSKHWHEFEHAARESGAGLYMEATVGGGIPIIRTINDSMQANNIDCVMGIINGTTNYILTKMSEEGSDFDEVLKDAQRLGYAEANPAADVEGYDAMYKLSILSSLCFHTHMPISTVYREGITKLTGKDFETAKRLGYEIKLLAIGKKRGNEVEVRVHPTMLPKDHMLAKVSGVFNAVFLHGHAVDNIMLYGRGAGCMPTASAVVSDIVCAFHDGDEHRHVTFPLEETMGEDVELLQNFSSIYCIRLAVEDKPGTLATVADAFARHGVSMKDVLQYDGETQDNTSEITFMTHTAREFDIQAALREIRELPCVCNVESVIRAES